MSKFNSIIESKYTQLLEQDQPVQAAVQQPVQPGQQQAQPAQQQAQPQPAQQQQADPLTQLSQQLGKVIDYKNPANAIKALNTLFPSNNPNNVNLFKQVGYDPKKGFITIQQPAQGQAQGQPAQQNAPGVTPLK